MKKNGVARNTYIAKVRKFASINARTFDDIEKFVKVNCKARNEEERNKVMDELCTLVDRMSHLNLDALIWCNKHGIDHGEFVCDIENRTGDFKTKTIKRRSKAMKKKSNKGIKCSLVVNNGEVGPKYVCCAYGEFPSIAAAMREAKSSGYLRYRLFVNNKVVREGFCNASR